MVQVRFVDLAELGVAPSAERVRMVIAQPHLPGADLALQGRYQLTGEAKSRQLRVLKRVMHVASTVGNANAVTQFTILPEYCIPGLQGVSHIEETLRSSAWACGTVLIGGVDALTRADYLRLIATKHTHHDQVANGASQVSSDQWLNCSITWVKSSDGLVQRWVQPKLWPAWAEAKGENQRMFKGGSVYLFQGERTNQEPFLFGTLVCFDWIAPSEPSPYERILEEIQRQAKGGQLPLTWLFVIQHNPKPSHQNFLSNVVSFFQHRRYPKATRDKACLVFANTAGLAHPGHCLDYGATSLVISPPPRFETSEATPTVSHQGFRYRGENQQVLKSAQCTDVFFRERGECIHVFDQINPSWVLAGPSGRSYAVENAEVHPALIADHVLAPRATVPAAAKWTNDAIDRMSREWPRCHDRLRGALETGDQHVVSRLRNLDAFTLTGLVRLATPNADANIDAWGVGEVNGLQHVRNTLRVFAAGGNLESVGTSVHAVVRFGRKLIDVIAIRADSHEACIEHIKNGSRTPRQDLLLVSRDSQNTPWDPRFGSFLERGTKPGSSAQFTDIAEPTYHVAYQDVLRFVREANEIDEVERRIEASARA